ncbi:MAG: hypothetical protein ACREMW_13860 [Gemmatimonadales bacterium]
MIDVTVRLPFTILHLALGLILAVEGVLTLIHGLSVHNAPHLIAFGAVEAIGALLFIWPRTLLVGGCFLLCAFLIAAAVHLLRGEFPSEHLVYAVAVLFSMVHVRVWSRPHEQTAALSARL